VVAFQEVTRPSTTTDGLHAPGLRFGDPRVMATLAATCRFAHVFAGFANRDLRKAVASLLGCDYTARQATYDLRRLGRKKEGDRPHSRNLPLPDHAPRTRDRRVLHEDLQSDPHPGLALFDRALDHYLTAQLTAA
jgi:hypothetical protein